MTNKIVADSSCDLTEKLKKKLNISLVPLKIDVEDKTFVDNESLVLKDLLDAMKKSKLGVKTAAPSPGDFLKEYEKGENVFVVTLSSQLSATYNNAVLAKDIALESGKKFIHVFDSRSASSGETLISLKIQEYLDKKLSNMEIVERVEKFIDNMKTFFILDSLDNLIKSGRVSKLKGHLASALSLRPIMGEDGNGNIKLHENIRGSKRAFKRLVEMVGEQGIALEERILSIAHCNALDKALDFKRQIQERYNFKDIIVVEMAGLSSVYANDQGIVIAF